VLIFNISLVEIRYKEPEKNRIPKEKNQAAIFAALLLLAGSNARKSSASGMIEMITYCCFPNL
jgi:hypothetical protein